MNAARLSFAVVIALALPGRAFLVDTAPHASAPPGAAAVHATPRAFTAGPARPATDSAPGSVLEPSLGPLRRADVPLDRPLNPERAPFGLRIGSRGRLFVYRVASTTALPGETLDFQVAGGRAGTRLAYGAGRVPRADDDGWHWVAPDSVGTYALRFEGPAGVIDVNVFVMAPRSSMRGEYLDGYRIGAYRRIPTQAPPRGFIRVRAADEDILLSPHFTVGQFLCKQAGSPRYLALSVPLVMKLEAVLERVAAAGYDERTLHIMSGYRTPWYNRAIGNTTTLSRHLWGDAADIFVDADGDGYMDDLNGDGRRDVQDARVLFSLVEQVERAGRPWIRLGGLSAYRKTQVRGPFLHVDARGRSARW